MLDELSALHRAVLRLTDMPRSAGTIAFLRGDPAERPAVQRALIDLRAVGLVEELEHELWRRTERGRVALAEADAWEVEVLDVFPISGRPRPVIVGRIHKGVVHRGEWFRTSEGRWGQVLTVELMCGPEVRDDAFAFTADIDIGPGDVLVGEEPLAG